MSAVCEQLGLSIEAIEWDHLVSLYGLMEEYQLGNFSLYLVGAVKAFAELSTCDALQHSLPSDQVNRICTDNFIHHLAGVIEGLIISCKDCDCDSALLFQMQTLEEDLDNGMPDRREGVLAARLAPILDGIKDNLLARQFMFMHTDQAFYYGNVAGVFGPNFSDTFGGKAESEALEALNCYASSRFTACVFHCMRVAEYGLRTIAQKVGAKITDTKKPCPIEYGTWDKVIGAIRSRIVEVRKKPMGQRKDERLKFYSKAADDCEYMKDLWRNDTAHARRLYKKPEALGVLERVRDFMRLLAGERQT